MLYTKLSANRYNQFGDSSFGAVTICMELDFFEEVSIFLVAVAFLRDAKRQIYSKNIIQYLLAAT